FLAVGPFLAIYSLMKLRNESDSQLIAQGRK
ncbi:hypothetical protein LCGC14_2672200, partial [marine sediment metagenome]